VHGVYPLGRFCSIEGTNPPRPLRSEKTQRKYSGLRI